MELAKQAGWPGLCSINKFLLFLESLTRIEGFFAFNIYNYVNLEVPERKDP